MVAFDRTVGRTGQLTFNDPFPLDLFLTVFQNGPLYLHTEQYGRLVLSKGINVPGLHTEGNLAGPTQRNSIAMKVHSKQLAKKIWHQRAATRYSFVYSGGEF